MKNENYYTIQGWMVNELKLTGNELICYAIIYGFCQDSVSYFNGNAKYISECVGCARDSALRLLKRLVDKNLVVKITQENTNVPSYKINEDILQNVGGGTTKCRRGYDKSSEGAYDKMSEAHIDINNNINNNINILSSKPDDFDARVVELWNSIAEKYKLAKVSMITPARHKALLARMKEHNIATPEELFDKIRQAIKESMLLKGRELVETPYGPEIRNKSWRPSFDFFICQPSSLLKALEGAYADPDLVR